MLDESVKLCVVLLNYRTPGLVVDCLSLLVPELEGINARVIVVDNHSEDDSIATISKWISARNYSSLVEIVDSGFNGGFAAGNNFGIGRVSSKYYLLLNSDTLLRGGSIQEMLHAMDANDRIGLLSPRLEWPDSTPQESCFRFHTPISEMIASSGTGVVLKLFSGFEVAQRVSDSSANYDWVSFACVLVRGQVFDDIGLLDDGFFMYFEDVEFCFRTKRAGWTIRNHPAAKVVHLRGGSSPVKDNIKERKRQVRYYYESRTRYFYKLYGRFGLLVANFLWTIGWLFACLRSVVQPRFQVPVCKFEWKDIWTNFGSPQKPFIHPKDYK